MSLESGLDTGSESDRMHHIGEMTPTPAGDKTKKINIQKELTEYRQAMMTMSSTLVETVSIDYEDFNESFLTCGTCLLNGRKSGMYDGGEHTPKLLPCSHTVCLQCLDRIVATFARDQQFRCPICRELINIPRGGVQALPPSFLVNQLLDLMARQRREVIPKCSTHQNQELLFCETCDTVFCTLCTGGSHGPASGDEKSAQVSGSTLDRNASLSGGGPTSSASLSASVGTVDHTVIPFSIAIKRMSEILIYKANECRAKLTEASEIVNEEIHRLDHNADAAFETVNARFQEVIDAVEKRKQEVLSEVKRRRDEKKKVLEEQLQIIQQERSKVDSDVQATQHQVEVRNITKKISDLNCKLDTVSTLCEPRENSYIEYEGNSDDMIDSISKALESVGQIKTSKTFPSLCRLSMETAIAHLSMVAKVTTMDYHGCLQDHGGDPVTSVVVDPNGDAVPCEVVDKEDGTYEIHFTPRMSGTFHIKVLIFDRPIKDCPLFFDVTSHNPPIVSFGTKGTKDKGFVQPCNVTVSKRKKSVFVIDTGNSRVKILSPNLDFEDHIYNECLEGRSVTGICMGSSDDSLIIINWRTKTVAEISMDGHTINSFTHDDFKEPIDVALDLEDHVLVADNGLGRLLVFDGSGKLLRTIGLPSSPKNPEGRFKDLSAICVAPNGDYLIADTNIYIFNSDGTFVREISGTKGGRFGGLACDANTAQLIATHTVKKQSLIQVFDYESGSLISSIDSHGCKMKRPMGLAIMDDGHLVVVDIGFDCVRKYRYR